MCGGVPEVVEHHRGTLTHSIRRRCHVVAAALLNVAIVCGLLGFVLLTRLVLYTRYILNSFLFMFLRVNCFTAIIFNYFEPCTYQVKRNRDQ